MAWIVTVAFWVCDTMPPGRGPLPREIWGSLEAGGLSEAAALWISGRTDSM